MPYHYGKTIRKAVKERGMTVAEFARRMKMSRENAYDIFRRESIDTTLLGNIEAVLHHVFGPTGSKDGTDDAIAVLTKKIEDLEKRMHALERSSNAIKKK